MTTSSFLNDEALSHSCSTTEEPMPQPNIFIFKSNVSFHLAQQKAEEAKKKTLLNNIFAGEFKKALSFIKGKPDIIYQDLYEYRLEPFWLIEGERRIDYIQKLPIQVSMQNRDIKSLELLGQTFDIDFDSGETLILEGNVNCQRKISYSFYKNGMNKDINEEMLSTYLAKFSKAVIEITPKDTENSRKFKALKDENRQDPIRLNPIIQLHQVETQMKDYLINQRVDGKITKDQLIINKINIYFRPIFAFKYKLSTDNSDIIIEVDGLTGDVITNGNWFKDKFDKVISAETAQDILIGIGCETMNKFIPFSGTAIQTIYNKSKT